MGKYLLIICLIIPFLSNQAQTVTNSTSFFLDAYDANGRAFTSRGNSNSEGTPLFLDSWAKGQVKFKNGFLVKEIDMQFNLVDNKPYFRKDSIVYGFADPVQEFRLIFKDKEDLKIFTFRNSYPGRAKNAEEIYYQVLSDGSNIQFLKLASKTVVESYQYGGMPKNLYRQTDQFYVFDVKKNVLTRIKKDKDAVMDALPGYEKEILQYINEKQSKLQSETEIAELIDFLNQKS